MTYSAWIDTGSDDLPTSADIAVRKAFNPDLDYQGPTPPTRTWLNLDTGAVVHLCWRSNNNRRLRSLVPTLEYATVDGAPTAYEVVHCAQGAKELTDVTFALTGERSVSLEVEPTVYPFSATESSQRLERQRRNLERAAALYPRIHDDLVARVTSALQARRPWVEGTTSET